MSLSKIEKDLKKRLPAVKIKESIETLGKVPLPLIWLAGEATISTLQTRVVYRIQNKFRPPISNEPWLWDKGEFKGLVITKGGEHNACMSMTESTRREVCEPGWLKRKIGGINIPVPGDILGRELEIGEMEYGSLLRLAWFLLNGLTAFRT